MEDDVAAIAKTVADNYFDSDLTGAFLDLVVQLYGAFPQGGWKARLIRGRTIEQPLKIPFVAAIVVVVNPHKPEFTTEVLKKAGEALQKYIDIGSWREVKLFLRLFGCLQGLFEGDGVFTILEELFSRAADLQMKSSEDVSPTENGWAALLLT